MKMSSIKSDKSDCVPAALSYQDCFNALYRTTDGTRHISVFTEIPDFGDTGIRRKKNNSVLVAASVPSTNRACEVGRHVRARSHLYLT
jgi:hypothetical protein